MVPTLTTNYKAIETATLDIQYIKNICELKHLKPSNGDKRLKQQKLLNISELTPTTTKISKPAKNP